MGSEVGPASATSTCGAQPSGATVTIYAHYITARVASQRRRALDKAMLSAFKDNLDRHSLGDAAIFGWFCMP